MAAAGRLNVMGLPAQVSLAHWTERYDEAREAGVVGYKSAAYDDIHPRTLDAMIRKVWGEEGAGMEVRSASYGLTGDKGKWSNAVWYGQWNFHTDDDRLGLSIIAKAGKCPLAVGVGARVWACTNGMMTASDAKMQFPQVSDLGEYLHSILHVMASKSHESHKALVANRDAMSQVLLTDDQCREFVGDLLFRPEGEKNLLSILGPKSPAFIARDLLTPQYDEFLTDGQRSMWSAYQALNDRVKFISADKRFGAFHAIHDHMASAMERRGAPMVIDAAAA
jgi:hypothetical protein